MNNSPLLAIIALHIPAELTRLLYACAKHERSVEDDQQLLHVSTFGFNRGIN
ncbi:hypothetical protein EGR_10611 [Echinococcus granulosus]|uniref:Uncharacterized protein n=1 Tax=Echinococcus granulosus TaxID=6210 RepID=W6U808_ECHGR|nr:hypothetical protein EGR_10611 [Echinococcus granulosus]EUB54527.1 hypothetical protein EGR_10611 [Echinococcus granulosus]